MQHLHPDLRLRIERCDGAAARVLHAQRVDTPVAETVAELDTLLGSRHARLGVVGSTSYRFPALLYKAEGVAAPQKICEAAAEAIAEANKGWSHLLIGGSWGGPQRTFAERLLGTCTTIVHVLPNCGEAIVDLLYILYEDGTDETTPRCSSAKLLFVGREYRVRNCVLAALCAQLFIIGGGPGTHLEVTSARAAGVGLLPLVRTGGLVEGMSFRGKHLQQIKEALFDTSPPCVSLEMWRVLLGDEWLAPKSSRRCSGCLSHLCHARKKSTPAQKSYVSFDEYLMAVRAVCRDLQVQEAPPPANVWPLALGAERDDWCAFVAAVHEANAFERNH